LEEQNRHILDMFAVTRHEWYLLSSSMSLYVSRKPISGKPWKSAETSRGMRMDESNQVHNVPHQILHKSDLWGPCNLEMPVS
jgi:hypothetical protein